MKKLITLLGVLFVGAFASAMELVDKWYELYMSNVDRMIMRCDDFGFKTCSVAIPVDGVKPGEAVTAVFTPGLGVKSIGAPKIYTDEWMFDYFFADLKKGLYDPEETDFVIDDEYQFDYVTAKCEYEIDSRIWFGGVKGPYVPDFGKVKPNPNRRWIVAKITPTSNFGRKEFTVRVGESSQSVTLFDSFDNTQTGIKPGDFCNRITFLDYEKEDFAIDTWEGCLCIDSLGDSRDDSVSVKFPEAGIYAEYDWDGNVTWSSTIPSAGVYSRQEMGKDDWWRDIRANYILFFPASKPSVGIVSTFCEFDEEYARYVVRGYGKGGGTFTPGEKATLTAVYGPESIFAGWEVIRGELPKNIDLKQPKLVIPVTEAMCKSCDPENLIVVRPIFKSVEEDREIVLKLNDEPVYPGQEIAWKDLVDGTLTIESISTPKLALKGLPTGLKLVQDKATGAYSITGSATKPGVYSVTVSLTNMTVKKATPLVVKVVVDNLQEANGFFVTQPMNAPGEKYALSVGVSDLSQLPSLQLKNPTAKLAVSELPAGLKYNAKTGAIEGVATKAGTYTVNLTVTEGKVKTISTFTIEVAALPEWAVGTFTGLVMFSNETYLGATVTISANGQATAKLTGAKTMSFKLGTYTSEVYGVYLLEGSADDKDGHEEFSIRVEGAGRPECGKLSGWIRYTPKGSWVSEEATIDADQNTWASKTFALPPLRTGTYWLSTDFSVLSVKVGAKGAVTLGTYDHYLAKKPVATASSQIAVWRSGEGWEGRIPYFIIVDKVANTGVFGWIDLTISKTGEISFALPESDPLPLNWYVGTYTGRVSDHVKMSGALYMDETMGATVSVDFKANCDAKATIVWDDGTRDTYTVKMTDGNIDPAYLTINAFFTDKLEGVALVYDVKIRIDRNFGSIPTASFSASSSGSLYIRTYYGYGTVYYSDNLQNTQPLKKVK